MTTAYSPKIKISNFKLIMSEKDKKFILAGMRKVLESHRWTAGQMVKAFEKSFKKYSEAKYSAAMSNAGAGLVAILKALKIPEGNVVLCPTLTAPPTPHAILDAKMKVVFADSDSNDLGLIPGDVEKKLDKYAGQVKAVIAVHIGGWMSPNITVLRDLCKKRGIPLIEDCAHAHGSTLNGKPAGSIAGLAAFSFFMTKPLPAGEGGIITSRSRRLIETIKIIRNYGKNEQGKHVIEGFNYKLSEFNAVVALWATREAPRLIEERRKIARIYDALLKDLTGIRIVKVPGCDCSYYKYIVVLKNGLARDRVREMLLSRYGVEASGGVYDTLCHEEPFFRTIPEKVLNVSGSFPQAEFFARRQLCLPLYPGLTEKEQEYVADCLKKSLQALKKENR